MKSGQIYCTEAEVIADLGLQGRDETLFSRIQATSKYIERRFGNFIPIRETRLYRNMWKESFVPGRPILSIEVLSNEGQPCNFYLLPDEPYWSQGPYSRVVSGGAVFGDVEITGTFGKYDYAHPLGLSVTQSTGDTTITVTDGSRLSPGMVLLVDEEQELIDGWGSAVDSTATLAADATESDEEISVTSGSLIHAKEVIRLSTEDCYVRAVHGNTLVVSRGWNGTTKNTHNTGAAVYVNRTVTITRGVNGTAAAAHDNHPALRQMVPDDVNWLARQITGLMIKKAQSGFAGKIGNAELGETFYFNEFPGQVKEIARNYRIVQV